MKTLQIFFLVAASLFPAANGARHAVPMKSYQVDLNDPPETRWNHVMEPYLPSIPLVLDYFNTLIPKAITPLVEAVMSDLEKYLGVYGRELQGIADYANIDLGMIVGLNLAYELRRLGGGHPNITGGDGSHDPRYVFGCTSIVARDQAGHIYHGRNMDWNIPEDIKNMTVQINFYRGSKFLYSGVTTVGYVGILTGVSPNGFSASINERDLGGNIFLDALQALTINNSRCPSHIMREVLEEATSYDDAHQRLSFAHLIAPVYYIMAGTKDNEGAILSHDRDKNDHEQTLGSAPYSTWYLMETNYDYWKAPPPTDDRRSYAHQYIQSKGQTGVASVEGILDILSEWPVWNRFTAYTATMDPHNVQLQGYYVQDL